jgi:SAM-dependent methyltransferase
MVHDVNMWVSAEHVNRYLSKVGTQPHGAEMTAAFMEQVPTGVKRVLDLGTGDGRLLALILEKNPAAKGVALDFSEPMLERVRLRFAGNPNVTVLRHDLNDPLPVAELGWFDLVVSGLAIHHLVHPRKRELYTEIYELLCSGGVFVNLDHVASPTEELHQKFLAAVGLTPQDAAPSNKLLDVHTQTQWLNQIGYKNADCHWKWLETAIIAANKP